MRCLQKINFQVKDILILTLLLAPFYFFCKVYFYSAPDEYYFIFTGIQLAKGMPITVQLDSPLLRGGLVPTTTPGEYINVRPIGQSLLIAVFYLIGGYPSIYYMNGLFTIFTVILTYFCAFEISKDRACSLLSAFLLGICPPMVYYSRTLFSDLPSVTFLLLSFFFYLKASKKNKYLLYVISSLSLGFAMLLRYPNILFLIPILLNQIRTRKLGELSSYLYSISLIPFVCAIGIYNAYFFGSFFTTGYHLRGFVFQFSFENFVFHLPQYFVVLNLFPPLGLVATFLYIRKKLDLDAHFVSFLVVLAFLLFYSGYFAFPIDIEHLYIEGIRYVIVVLPYLCINAVAWFRDNIKSKNLSFSIPIAVFIAFIIINIVMISQYNALLTKKVYYRDLFYTNTEPNSLIIGNAAWYGLFFPLQEYEDRYYLRYNTFSESEIIEELLPFIDTWIKDKPVYFINDPYVKYSDSEKHELIWQLLTERFGLHSVIATDSPYSVELFKVSRVS